MLNRPTSVTSSTDAAASTSYTYALTSPSWTDPSGTYGVTLDKFDREVGLSDPIHGASAWTTTYGADGQPASVAAPNGNTTLYGYDGASRLAAITTTGTGSVARADYSLTHNAAGKETAEASTISGDPTNGTTADAYDPLGRLTSYTPPTGSALTYGWQATPVRSSVKVGAASPVTGV